MKRQFIVTAPIEYGRYELEETFECSGDASDMETIADIMEDKPELILWDIEDFTEYCNNEEFSVDDCWMTHVTIDVPDNYTPNNSTWYLYLIRF